MNRIAHRGNISGINIARENKIDYLQEALDAGYWVECDIQYTDDGLYLGHDEPQEYAPINLMRHSRVICHAKDLDSVILLDRIGAHYFWHESDRITLTSKGYMWCYPGEHINHSKAIWLDLADISLPNDIPASIFGICADDFS
jgi:hypothetical protein